MSVVIEAQNISKRFFLGERNRTTFLEEWTAFSKDAVSLLLRRKKPDSLTLFGGNSGPYGTYHSRSTRGKR